MYWYGMFVYIEVYKLYRYQYTGILVSQEDTTMVMYVMRYISWLVLIAIYICMIALAKVVPAMGMHYIIPGSTR